MKIFFFGGTFDPPHIGHKMIVDKCYDKCDKFIIFPNLKSPHKIDFGVTEYIHRLKMLKILFKKYRVEIDEFEILSKANSYTYDTIQYLKKKYNGASLTMLIGYDQLLNLKQWYRYDEIIKDINILCFNRKHAIKSDLECLENIEIVDDFDFNISSSYIRKNYSSILRKNGKKYLDKDVLEYIKENCLYGI